ncbi:MAG: hypothetical protein HY301_17665, partial [Verrucomicrobia bacterium]|nr:hypothetical protein [Verrucomicrobiota bacterium]
MTPRATQPELKAGSSTRMARQPRLLLPIQVTLWLMIFTLACMTALAVWWVASRKGVSEFGSLARHLSPAIEPTVRHLRPGPWGELTGLRMFIPAPAEFIEDILAERPVAWRFPGHTADSLEDGLRRFGFSDQELELARSAPWEVTPAGVTIAPTDELVLELGADTRSRLYNFLADFPVNQHFRFTIVLSREAWDEILASEKIPARTTQLIRRLLYQRGDRLLLTDLALVARSLPEAKQRIALGELLATSETLNLRLTIRPGTD